MKYFILSFLCLIIISCSTSKKSLTNKSYIFDIQQSVIINKNETLLSKNLIFIDNNDFIYSENQIKSFQETTQKPIKSKIINSTNKKTTKSFDKVANFPKITTYKPHYENPIIDEPENENLKIPRYSAISFISGILSILTLTLALIIVYPAFILTSVIFSALAFYFGEISLKLIKQFPDKNVIIKSKIMAITGFVIGLILTSFFIITILIVLFIVAVFSFS